MATCDLCWDEAFRRAQTRGGFQADHYHELLIENANHPDHMSDATEPASSPPESE